MAKLYEDLRTEVEAMQKQDLHPKVVALIQAFLNYLKEPRYQNPLSITELSTLFAAFYEDLNSLVLDIYTQSNSNKRQLIQQSIIFSADEQTYDYLNAIANYSSNSAVKLQKRSDAWALYQLRIFTYYKFLTVCKSIELAQKVLFSSTAPSESTALHQKLLRYDSRDIAIQDLLCEKIHILRNLNLPIECFFEATDFPEFSKINQFFMTLEDERPSALAEVKAHFAALATSETPYAKLQQIVRIQKSLINLCALLYDKDSSKVSNDVLLPALIYTVIYYLPSEQVKLYLNLKFVKSFWNMLDPEHMSSSHFTLSSSVSFYNPTNRKNRKPFSSKSLFELLSLVDGEDADFDAIATDKNEEFRSNASIVELIQTQHLNNGELQFYLTNFEAILFFLQNTPILEMVPVDYTIPSRFAENELISTPVQLIVDREEPALETSKLERKIRADLFDDEFDEPNRSRSSSLFNTISSAVSQSVRSRSNSSALKHSENKELPQSDFEESLSTILPSQDAYGLSQVKGILGKIGSVSNYQFKVPVDIEIDSPEKFENRSKRSQSLLDRISPSHTRTRSESENVSSTAPRKPTMLSTKWSSGVSEFMNKISTAASSAASNHETSLTTSHPSQTSLHSIDDPFEDQTRRLGYGIRSSSIQTMDKWLNNIPANSSASLVESKMPQNDDYTPENNEFSSTYNNEGSVFSVSFGELTKYQSVDFESLTINDLKNLKRYYDQLCAEVLSTKTESKTSNDYMDDKDA